MICTTWSKRLGYKIQILVNKYNELQLCFPKQKKSPPFGRDFTYETIRFFTCLFSW
jgi:hypothetical protein